MKAGCFRIGNTGGMMDNVIACKLHRPGWCDLIGQHFVECIPIIMRAFNAHGRVDSVVAFTIDSFFDVNACMSVFLLHV